MNEATVTMSENPTSPVTWENFTRAETDQYFKNYVEKGAFGSFYHLRSPTPIDQQDVVAMNRDTIYSIGIFDLTEPVTIRKPETGDRFQSMLVLDEDQYAKQVRYDAGEFTLTQEQIGTRYVGVLVRTFADPNDPADVEEANRLQDEIVVDQDSPGEFEIPNWDLDSLKRIRDALIVVGETLNDSRNTFGDVDEVHPVKFLLGCATGWGGNPTTAATYLMEVPERNDGETSYTLTVGEDVPVDGFWSITVYNSDMYLEANEYDAYSVNNVTAERNNDGSVTVHFGGDPTQSNFLYTPDGWRYIVRLYRPRDEILNGAYQFPKALPAD